MIFAIDPGCEASAYVIFDGRLPISHGKLGNEELLGGLPGIKKAFGPRLVIEMIKSYGNAMGDTTIETCVWIGRFLQAWGEPVKLVPRKSVVTEITGNPRANDSNVRRALIDYFRERIPRENWGAGSEPLIGTAKKPGPLFGISSDVWSALALAVSLPGVEEKEIRSILA